MPEGHPPLKNFIGVPIFLGPNLVGQVGFANRAQGWTEDDGRFLETWGSMLGALIVQFDDYLRGTKQSSDESAKSEATNKSIPKDRLEQQGKGALSEPCGHVEEESRITDDTISSDVIVESGLRPGERFANQALIQAHTVDSISDGIIIFDEKRTIQFCNVGATTMLKFNSAKDLLSCYPTFDQLLAGGLSRNASLNHFDLDQTLRMSSIVATGVRFEAELKKAPTEAGTDL
eukprot:scaffold1152_cov378-Pavlova_lutheri.AAC.1